MVVVAISELGKLAALKKKRQLVDKKVVQDAINQFNGTESDHKDDISIDDKEAAELIIYRLLVVDADVILVVRLSPDDKEAAELIIYRLGLRIDENYIATVAHSPSTFTSRSH